jgi:transcriptional antiterminator NusG
MIDVTPNTPESETPEPAPAEHAAPPVEHADAGEHTLTPEPEPQAVHAAPEPEPEPQPEPEEPAAEPAAPAAAEAPVTPAAPPVDTKKKWYVVKVQSGREESIKAAIERKVKIEGLEEFFGQIAIPVEQVTQVKKVTEKKNGEKVTKEKRVVKDQKKYPGYIFAEVEFNDRILYLFRETSGVGDFVGATGPMKPPPPMNEREVQAMLNNLPGAPDDKRKPGKMKVKIEVEKGDKVRVREGAFSGMEGEVKSVTEPKDDETPKVTVVVTVFGRPVDVTLDYWQVDKV